MGFEKCDYYNYTRNCSKVYSKTDISKMRKTEKYNQDFIKNEIIKDYCIDSFDQIYNYSELKDGEKLELSSIIEKAIDNKDFFLLWHLPKLPTSYDARYEIISKFSSTEYASGMERKKCLEFEILARDKNNVYAIEDAIEFYIDNYETFDFIAKRYKHEHNKNIVTTLSSTHSTIYLELQEKLKLLKLVSFKYHQEEDKFQHWAVNPFIYEIINFYTFEQNTISTYKVIPLAVDTKNSISSYQLNSLNNNDTWIQSNNLLDDGMVLRKTILTTHLNDSSNKNLVDNRVTYSPYYPKLRECSRLNIEIDLTSNKDVMQSYLKDIIQKLFDEKNDISIDDVPKDLLKIDIDGAIPKSPYADKFFVYDYFIYRREQIDHQELHFKSADITDMSFEELEEEFKEHDLIFEYWGMLHDKYYMFLAKGQNAKALIDIKSSIKKLLNLTKIEDKDIHNELSKILILSSSGGEKFLSTYSIENYITDITNLIKKSKYTPYFLQK